MSADLVKVKRLESVHEGYMRGNIIINFMKSYVMSIQSNDHYGIAISDAADEQKRNSSRVFKYFSNYEKFQNSSKSIQYRIERDRSKFEEIPLRKKPKLLLLFRFARKTSEY